MPDLRIRTAAALAAACAVLCTSPAQAEKLVWRHSFHINKSAGFGVPDRAGHAIGAGEGTGLGFFGSDVATLKLTYAVDFTNAEGPFTAYETYTFADGSTLSLRREGQTVEDKRSRTATLKGRFSFVGGTGRFAGIEGGGSFKGERLQPLSVGADQYVDFVADYTLTNDG